jgi:hypothetical protein
MNKRLNREENQARWQRFRNTWKDHSVSRLILFGILGISLFLFMLGNVLPDYVHVEVGSRAEQDIISPVTVIDEEATQRAKDLAARNVHPVYVMDSSITDKQVQQLQQTFNTIKEIVESDHSDSEKRTQLEARLPIKLQEETYDLLLDFPVAELDTVNQFTRSIVYEIMYDGVRNEDLPEALQKVDSSLILSSLDSAARRLAQELAKASIVPNFVVDPEETERMREQAVEQVRPILIREGEVIVSEGEYITHDHYRKLGIVGLLSESANLYPLFGLGLFTLLMLALIFCYIHFSGLPIRTDNRQFLMFVLIFLLNVFFLKVVSIGQVLEYQGIGFVAPVAFATMTITMLLHQRLAIFSSFLFAIIASIILNGETTRMMDITYGITMMFSGLSGAFFLGNATRKTRFLQAGFVVSLVTICAMATMVMMTQSPFNWLMMAKYAGYAFFSGILASILTIGILPFLEAAFGILSHMKLIELSNPNQPLLRKILLEAPGTYHHSVMVANLAEAAAEAVGANGLLARVGAYYHDIGKTKRPHFFIENQLNMENPHDKIAPQLSATIITAHTRDGAQLLKKHKFPQAICDIAQQHHGTTLLKYFYAKAKEQSEGPVNESDFRYDGPKAQFKESAIVGIADSVEAAVRSLSKPSPERIENIVRQIIKDRLEDGQFNECDLTLKELDTIAKVICETLKGMFHSRIEYPEDVDKGLRKSHAKQKGDKTSMGLKKVEGQ